MPAVFGDRAKIPPFPTPQSHLSPQGLSLNIHVIFILVPTLILTGMPLFLYLLLLAVILIFLWRFLSIPVLST